MWGGVHSGAGVWGVSQQPPHPGGGHRGRWHKVGRGWANVSLSSLLLTERERGWERRGCALCPTPGAWTEPLEETIPRIVMF